MTWTLDLSESKAGVAVVAVHGGPWPSDKAVALEASRQLGREVEAWYCSMLSATVAEYGVLPVAKIRVQLFEDRVVDLSSKTPSFRAVPEQPLGPSNPVPFGPAHFLARFEAGARVHVHLSEVYGRDWETGVVIDNPEPIVPKPDPRAAEAARVVSFDEFNVRRHGDE